MARRLLPGVRDHQGHRSANRRSPPARLCRHAGTRTAMLVVPRVGADAQADRPV
jgi:hypothetical protein